MSERPVTVIGFVPAALASLAEFRPDRSVILIEEPDVVRKRGVRAAAADAPVVREFGMRGLAPEPAAAEDKAPAHS
ncbi:MULTISPECIES: hypothetical protein [Streptomyces]|uniref:hypothetical protein n=1 Tax=Streptomyces TaxID=1883 RepID=UPI000939008E|nr:MULTISPECIES: hypothetical protein [Streptomyces]OKJ60659.1 hypothetical protein AMK29_25990 [Streptomyces sp. CB02261]